MAGATYYIEVDTYWQNSKSYFVGPFVSKDAATAWWQQDDGADTREDNVWLSTSMCGGDISRAWRIFPTPLSKTEARKHGLRRYEDGDGYDNEIAPRVKPQARALSNAVAELREYAY